MAECGTLAREGYGTFVLIGHGPKSPVLLFRWICGLCSWWLQWFVCVSVDHWYIVFCKYDFCSLQLRSMRLTRCGVPTFLFVDLLSASFTHLSFYLSIYLSLYFLCPCLLLLYRGMITASSSIVASTVLFLLRRFAYWQQYIVASRIGSSIVE
jgi:hypothetical protein